MSLNINQTAANQGAGIDVASIVDQLIYTEQATERIWQQEKITHPLGSDRSLCRHDRGLF
jgi:hypothetical protein